MKDFIKILCGLVILISILAGVFGVKLSKTSKQLAESQEGYQYIKNNFDICSNDLVISNDDKDNYKWQLNQCKNELQSLKNSAGYAYSAKIFPSDQSIKRLAVENIKNFDDIPNCAKYLTRCIMYTPIGDCIYEETYCADYNEDKQFYNNYGQSYYMKAIISNYMWVRDNIEYTLDYDWMINPQTALETLNVRGGNCNEKTTLLASLIMSSGVTANPVILTDINHMILAVTFDGIEDLNLPSTVKTNNKTYLLLDPTCKWCAVGTLPDMDYGQRFDLLDYYDINK